MIIIGVTGPIAAGKSTVDAMLRDLGAAPVIDADTVVHDLYERSARLQHAVATRFGRAVRRDDGGIDRRALGALVFGDPDRLRRLEEIVHPAVRAEVRARLQAAPHDAVAVVDAVKLLQGDLAAMCTQRWWVACDPTEQRRRLIVERRLSPDDADRRIAAQPRLADVRDRIDVVVDNSGSLAETRRQVEMAWHAIRAGQTDRVT